MKHALFEKIESLLDIDRNEKYRVLDIGSGQGDLLGRLTNLTAPDSRLVGIDAMPHAVDNAKRKYPSLDFYCEKFSNSLSFEDNSFDIVVSVDTFECIPNKNALVNEIYRVLSPCGRVATAHWDWDTQVYSSENKAFVRELVAAFSDWQQPWMEASNGQMGRRLWGLFEGSGQFTGKVSSYTLLETEFRKGNYGYDRLRDLAALVDQGCIDRADYETVWNEMESLSKKSQYFYSLNSYVYTGKAIR